MSSPQLIAIAPAANSGNVSIQPTMRLTYDRALDPTSVDATRFAVLAAGTQTVTAAADVVVQNDTITWTPAEPLVYETDYTVVVTPGIAGRTGEPSIRTETWTFTTGASPFLATPLMTSPIDGERIEALTFTWSAVTGASYTLQLCRTRLFAGAEDVELWTWGDLATTTFTAGIDPPIGSYYARVQAFTGAGDTYEASSWSPIVAITYQTALTPAGIPPTPADLWAGPASTFTLLRTEPASGTCNATPAAIVLTFSGALHSNTLTPGTPQYAPPRVEIAPLYGGITTDADPAGWVLDGATLRYPGPFAANTTYQVFLSPELCSAAGDHPTDA
jgi:hypothetical protein